MQRPTVGVVITAYNCWDIALRCVRAHLKHAAPALERIVVIDDCSDETHFGPLDPKVRIVRNEKNLGFVKSVNVGFKNLDTDLILLFDADAYPLMDYSDVILREFSADPRLGIIGFTTYDENDQVTGSSEDEPGVLTLMLGQRMDSLYQRYFVKSRSETVVYSCAMAVRKKAFEEVGGFDESFDWLDPDIDLCLRMKKAGWKVKQSPEVKAFHTGGGAAQLSGDRVLRVYKNRWYLLKKYGKIKHVFFVRNLILMRLRLEYLAMRLFGNLIYDDKATIRDKVSGRKKALDYCKENYR